MKIHLLTSNGCSVIEDIIVLLISSKDGIEKSIKARKQIKIMKIKFTKSASDISPPRILTPNF